MFFHLKIILRNLRCGGIYSAINIGGLAIGMAVFILIMSWINHEWSYDRFHANEKQLYKVWNRANFDGSLRCWDWTPPVMGPTLKTDYPEIAAVSRMQKENILFSLEDKKFNVAVGLVDPDFLTMFSFPLLKGSQESALNDSYSAILTEKVAVRLFDNEDPVGKTVMVNSKNPVTITGVLKDLPDNTSFDFEILMPFEYVKVEGWYQEYWGYNSIATYVELQPQATESNVNDIIVDIVKKHTNDVVLTDVFLHPISKWHLYSEFENGVIAGGKIETLRLFGLIALLILIVACINFMNLSTARSEKRAKEVGVRKVMGAKRLSLIRHFFGESTIFAIIAGFLAFLLAVLALPAYNTFMGDTLSLDFDAPWFWIAFIGFILFTGLMAGSYPAFYLSSFLPIKVLKGKLTKVRTLVAPRKLLVITQFAVAVFLIFTTSVIHRQMHYAQERNNGYNKEQLIYCNITGDMEKNYELIKHDLLNSGTAISVTKTSAPITLETISNTTGYEWKGKNPDDNTLIDRFNVDADWVKTSGVTLIEGRDIDVRTYPTDSTAVLLNESSVKLMNLDHPVGEILRLYGTEWHVVGVVKDFIIHSPYEATKPIVISGSKGALSTIHIKFNEINKMSDHLKKTEQIFSEYNPTYPFEYTFVDDEYARKFESEQRLGLIFTWLASLTVFISCMGMFGLVAYMAENRRKEIGVRKVLGASVTNIILLLSREFFVLVVIALFVALPTAWWALNKWLSGYAYRTEIPLWLFLAVAALTMGIALLTVSFQAIKAAMANPVNSIKN